MLKIRHLLLGNMPDYFICCFAFFKLPSDCTNRHWLAGLFVNKFNYILLGYFVFFGEPMVKSVCYYKGNLRLRTSTICRNSYYAKACKYRSNFTERSVKV